jgi:hypothetical protein
LAFRELDWQTLFDRCSVRPVAPLRNCWHSRRYEESGSTIRPRTRGPCSTGTELVGHYDARNPDTVRSFRCLPDVRQAVWAVDKNLPLSRVAALSLSFMAVLVPIAASLSPRSISPSLVLGRRRMRFQQFQSNFGSIQGRDKWRASS